MHFVQDAAQITDYLDEGNLTLPALRSLLRIMDPMLPRGRRYLELMPRRGYDNHRLSLTDLEILLSAVTYVNRKANYTAAPPKAKCFWDILEHQHVCERRVQLRNPPGPEDLG